MSLDNAREWELQAEIARLREALEQIANFGHAEGCNSSAPVYECCCYEDSQWDIAKKALRGGKDGE